MSDNSHLFQFFVSTRMQRRGIARRLWPRVIRDAPRQNAALYLELFGDGSAGIAATWLRARWPLLITAGGVMTQPM